ncbi:hypothetical protein Godav_021576 [Gossypium davidsonii]|uniref:Protein kinase domain-containing protein n=2 Tax=Gossypium TaxID=3633 RepID=A0A7J8R6T1_GOSDV|nr:hypothetical protein [Gossypium davidsonii]MBA0644575.1 hypothetical protein [Gossypium klotzschianum]
MEILEGAHNQYDISEKSLTKESDFSEEKNSFHDAGLVNLAVQGGLEEQLVYTFEINKGGINIEVKDFHGKACMDKKDCDRVMTTNGSKEWEDWRRVGIFLISFEELLAYNVKANFLKAATRNQRPNLHLTVMSSTINVDLFPKLLPRVYVGKGMQESQFALITYTFVGVLLPLPWSTRMKIALGAAKGLAFLHEADKPVIYRDFKTSNILLDLDYNAKLSDFGLAKDGPEGDKSHVSTRIMGTYGYAAPEYIMTGHLSPRSDVYSFGVVLLELLTGRKSLDKSRPAREQNLTDWALPLLKEKKKLLNIVDPRLQGDFPIKAFHKAAMLAYHCLNRNPKARPLMRDIVDSLDPLQLSHPLPIEKTIVTVSTEAASYSFVAYMDESSEHIVCGKPYNGIQ